MCYDSVMPSLMTEGSHTEHWPILVLGLKNCVTCSQHVSLLWALQVFPLKDFCYLCQMKWSTFLIPPEKHRRLPQVASRRVSRPRRLRRLGKCFIFLFLFPERQKEKSEQRQREGEREGERGREKERERERS